MCDKIYGKVRKINKHLVAKNEKDNKYLKEWRNMEKYGEAEDGFVQEDTFHEKKKKDNVGDYVCVISADRSDNCVSVVYNTK